jgi:acetolactate synthase-1/2/3 large subunit
MKVTNYIAQFLAAQGVSCVFEMSGGMITHLLDSIHQQGDVRIVSVHHEQTAAFAADAAGRITGVPGVAMATSGPGATNLLTGIGSCFFDSSPSVFITGQVNRNEQKGDRAIRQLGFQETDIVSMALPITKAAWMVMEPEDVPEALERAFRIATEGRPGPVLLDIPMDVQRGDINVPAPVKIQPKHEMNSQLNGVHPNGVAHSPNGASSTNSAFSTNSAAPLAPDAMSDDPAFWNEMWASLANAERPLILVGGGVNSARVVPQFRELVAALGIPVVYSLMAVDAVTYDDPFRAGWHGSYGNRWANLAIGRSDLLLVLGSRLDVRQTGADTKAFKGEREVFQVDVEPGEMNNRITGCRTLLSHLQPFLAEASKQAPSHPLPARKEWLDEINELREAWPDTKEVGDVPLINPNEFIHVLSQHSQAAGAYLIDVGQHQMWAAQSVELGQKQRFLTSGGMGSMGFALPAAVGAAAVLNGQPVVVIAGDGGFQTNIQELQTIVRNGWPVKIVVINNNCHGMVRQFQESYFDSRYQSTLWGYDSPDFARVAEAYGIPGMTVSEPEKMEEAAAWLWSDPTKPALLQVMVDTLTNAYPKIAFGKPMTEMEPFFQPIEMEST